jgi:hypothetical protein
MQDRVKIFRISQKELPSYFLSLDLDLFCLLKINHLLVKGDLFTTTLPYVQGLEYARSTLQDKIK